MLATDWSGMTEFLSPENSYPVAVEALFNSSTVPGTLLLCESYSPSSDSNCVGVNRNVSPQHLGHLWAKPSVGHAAELMRRVFRETSSAAAASSSRRERASARGRQARRDVQSQYSLPRTAERVMAELERVREKAIDEFDARLHELEQLRLQEERERVAAARAGRYISKYRHWRLQQRVAAGVSQKSSTTKKRI